MTEVYLLLIIFILLNVLDSFTTWLGLYRLPVELRPKERNILFKDIETKFWPSIITKWLIVLFGAWLFWRLASVLVLRVIDLAFVTVVLNNAYVYLTRRLTGKKYRSPFDLFEALLRKCRLPKKAAGIASFYILVSAILVACYFIAGAIP